MPMLVKILYTAGALSIVTWLLSAYWQFRLYRRLHKESQVMFRVSDSLSTRERYKLVLAKDSSCRELARKRNISFFVFAVYLCLLSLVLGIVAWFEVYAVQA